MAVPRGVGDLLVAEQHLDDADVFVLFQQVRGEGMTQGVQGYFLVDACLSPCLMKNPVELSR